MPRLQWLYWSTIACAIQLGSATQFIGAKGDYCSTRTPSCCENRDDKCTVPILGTRVCYCDFYCDKRTKGNRCCPDFDHVCKNKGCYRDGMSYLEGEKIKAGFSTCTCLRSQWSCSSFDGGAKTRTTDWTQSLGPTIPKEDLIIKCQTNFALRLLKQQYVADKQLLLSPFSITAALVFPHMGIAEDSKTHIYNLIAHNEIYPPYFYEYVKQKLGMLSKHSSGLKMAICFFIHDSLPIKEKFLERKQHLAGTLLGFKAANFAEAQITTSIINDYVSSRTNNTILNVVSPNDISEVRPALIVDAVYFHAAWKNPFDTTRTIPKRFSLGGGQLGTYLMMRATADFIYEDKGDVQILGIPFEGDKAKMFIILPQTTAGLSALLQKLDEKTLNSYTKIGAVYTVEVQLPKFKVPKRVEVLDLLAKMSDEMPYVLNDVFSEITEDPVKLSHFVHKTFINIDEHGVNAPAIAQHVLSEPKSLAVAKFHADHPFLYIIESDNVLLFVGTYP